jgi:hypothetical protein
MKVDRPVLLFETPPFLPRVRPTFPDEAFVIFRSAEYIQPEIEYPLPVQPPEGSRFMQRLASVCLMGLLLSATTLFGAGQRTHLEMGKRALDAHCADVETMLPGFREVFADEEAIASYYAGCMFPDWGFGGINDQAAEDAHWRKFQETYYKYLVEKCPRPWDADERRRVAFFLGIVCHGMTDLPWHFSKEGHQSLLAMSWGADRAGHTETEATYDIFLYRDGTPPKNLIPRLKWPMEDIQEVYRRFGAVVPQEQLDRSLQRTHAMFNGGPLAASVSASSLESKFPWVKKQTEGYYFGGVEHGGALTASWLKFYYAAFMGVHFLQSLPTAVTENDDHRVYQGCIDASLLSAHPVNNTGGEPYLDLCGNGKEDKRAALLHFQLPDASTASPIAKGELWLYHVDWIGEAPTGPKTLAVRAATSDWNEGVGMTNDITGWKGQPHTDGSINWKSFSSSSSQPSKPIDRVKVDPSKGVGRWLKWDITPLVQQWSKEKSANKGVLITEEGEGTGIVRVYSSEAFRTSADGMGGGNRIAYRPILILWPTETK